MKTIRTFIAIELAKDVEKLARQFISRMNGCDESVRWVKNENLHLTLKFLGDIPNVEVHKACQIAERVAATQEPFTIQTVGVGAFPTPDQPRTLWLGCEQPDDEPLNSLHEKLEDAYDELRVPPDKKRYRPHVTLGRIKRAGPETRDLAGRIRNYPPFDPIETPVTELIVFGSFLDSEGPTYNVLGRAPLA